MSRVGGGGTAVVTYNEVVALDVRRWESTTENSDLDSGVIGREKRSSPARSIPDMPSGRQARCAGHVRCHQGGEHRVAQRQAPHHRGNVIDNVGGGAGGAPGIRTSLAHSSHTHDRNSRWTSVDIAAAHHGKRVMFHIQRDPRRHPQRASASTSPTPGTLRTSQRPNTELLRAPDSRTVNPRTQLTRLLVTSFYANEYNTNGLVAERGAALLADAPVFLKIFDGCHPHTPIQKPT
ncbi:hypothetical protein B0H12DRAFT_1077404 [Mycena haematopus]|nr:hypothetical protein B0H12DRAFT_1077404 [Mycena haematopus]